MAEEALVLFDGDCAMCSAWVWFVLDRDRAARFRFAPLTSALGAELRRRHGLEHIDSIILVEGERAWVRSGAALRILRSLPRWRLLYALVVIPRFLRDAVYRLIAAHRRRIVAGACRLPTPIERARFLP
ncbi:MAG TPA: DCC1-like thiol-disulfide oxidoreductase family protein [Planctomycetota bacterium]|nr:DCC1-like thiol-disulfide oxidoreductase family protein [Planctomycetota bacterium]